jgi:hypothetical protein
MGFLDNSGDIILDAVLTDTGRYRLARGDGSFKIAKYGFGDDEINYAIYNKNHSSGSAYYDLKILQTPVLEAFTNNASTMNSKLVSIPRTNLLFLPVMMLNVESDNNKPEATSNIHYVTVDKATQDLAGFDNANTGSPVGGLQGVMYGVSPGDGKTSIMIDQGLNTTKISNLFPLDADLKEGQYIIQMDNRLGIISSVGGAPTPVNFIDDDNIATYYVSSAPYVKNLLNELPTTDAGLIEAGHTPIQGPTGTRLEFKILSATSLKTDTYLFTTLGGGLKVRTPVSPFGGSVTEANNVYYIDSSIKVTGVSTGYSIDIPIRYIKQV